MLRQVGLIALALAAPHVAGAAGCPTPVPPAMQAVTHAVATVNGFKVDQYSWFDSKCLARTAALKQEGGGNKGHGGYAVQMTYHLANNALVTANAPVASDGGFGYFVSHERYRDFTDGKSGTIALHVFHVDDSPLGLDFPVVGAVLAPTATSAAQRYTTTYSHYGTVAPIPKNAKGDDVTPTPVDKTKLAKYLLPVTLTWVFQAQHDSPRVDVKVDLSQVPGPGPDQLRPARAVRRAGVRQRRRRRRRPGDVGRPLSVRQHHRADHAQQQMGVEHPQPGPPLHRADRRKLRDGAVRAAAVQE